MIWVFLGVVLVQVGLWGWVLRFIPQSVRPHPQPLSVREGSSLSVSVIVCFHNEIDSLRQCLLGILRQDYPNFEVVAVDDNSTDGSGEVVRKLMADHHRLRLVEPGVTRPGKKDALTAGIMAAHHQIILLTDADCAPASAHWISLMAAPFAGGAEVVLGCSPYRKAPGWLNFWQRFEATYTAMQYVGFARQGMPYMGVGRNLAYRKSFFTRAGGLAAHADLPGGDDDLLIGRHALPENTVCVTAPEAWTYSAPTTDWRMYMRQKWRHQSVGPRYKMQHQVILTGLALTHGLFFLTGFMLLFTSFWAWVLYFYVVRFSFVYDAFGTATARRFLGGNPDKVRDVRAGRAGAKNSPRWWHLLLGDVILAPYYTLLAIATALPAKRW